MIGSIKNYGVSNCPNYTSSRQSTPRSQKRPLTYAHAVGSAGLLGLSAMGFSTIFMRGWKMPIAIGTAFAGLMLLFNVPDKLYKRK